MLVFFYLFGLCGLVRLGGFISLTRLFGHYCSFSAFVLSLLNSVSRSMVATGWWCSFQFFGVDLSPPLRPTQGCSCLVSPSRCPEGFPRRFSLVRPSRVSNTWYSGFLIPLLVSLPVGSCAIRFDLVASVVMKLVGSCSLGFWLD